MKGGALALLVAWAGPMGSVAAKEASSMLGAVECARQGDHEIVRIVGSEAPNFTAYRLEEPPRVVIEWSGSRLGPLSRALRFDEGVVRRVRLRQYGGEAEPVSRIEIELWADVRYRMEAVGRTLVVRFESPAHLRRSEPPVRPVAPSDPIAIPEAPRHAALGAAVTPVPTAPAPILPKPGAPPGRAARKALPAPNKHGGRPVLAMRTPSVLEPTAPSPERGWMEALLKSKAASPSAKEATAGTSDPAKVVPAPGSTSPSTSISASRLAPSAAAAAATTVMTPESPARPSAVEPVGSAPVKSNAATSGLAAGPSVGAPESKARPSAEAPVGTAPVKVTAGKSTLAARRSASKTVPRTAKVAFSAPVTTKASAPTSAAPAAPAAPPKPSSSSLAKTGPAPAVVREAEMSEASVPPSGRHAQSSTPRVGKTAGRAAVALSAEGRSTPGHGPARAAEDRSSAGRASARVASSPQVSRSPKHASRARLTSAVAHPASEAAVAHPASEAAVAARPARTPSPATAPSLSRSSKLAPPVSSATTPARPERLAHLSPASEARRVRVEASRAAGPSAPVSRTDRERGAAPTGRRVHTASSERAPPVAPPTGAVPKADGAAARASRRSLAQFRPAAPAQAASPVKTPPLRNTPRPTARRANGPRGDLKYIGFQNVGANSRVTMRLNRQVAYEMDARPDGITVRLSRVRVPLRVNTLPLDTSYFSSPITHIQAKPGRNQTVVHIKTRTERAPELRWIGTTLILEVPR